jgi:uncharacterized Tic20 family protein
MNITPTTEDRIWAVLSHLSTLAFGMGVALPVIGWADQRRKSPYATFHCLQAMGYQSLGFTVWVLSYLVFVILAVVVLLAAAQPGEGSSAQSPGLVLIFIVVGFLVLYLILPVIAAVACALGRDFRYPILGDRLARYLGYHPAQIAGQATILHEERELRWVAAMGHFSVLIWFWGMLAPLMAWLLFGKNSFFLKFQSLQTLVFQALVTLLSLAGLFLYLFAFLFLLVGMGGIDEFNPGSPIAIVGMVTFAVVLLIALVLILLVPFFHILGQWAGYRVLKGDEYHYPLLGQLVDRWISNKGS